MIGNGRNVLSLSLCSILLLALNGWAQNTTASLTGLVTDPSGAIIPNGAIELTSVSTSLVAKTVSNTAGLYSFQNVPSGEYQLKVTAPGFREFLQKGIKISLNERATLDITLQMGEQMQVIEVRANASPLNTETPEVAGRITPETVNELPLIMSNNGGMRSAATFITLLPGVTAGTGGDVINSHLNGAQKYSGESLVNGASSINPSGGNGMWSAAFDFGQSPEMTSELKVLTANYEPQYGSTGGSIFIMETKSGTNEFHGDAYYYGKNDVFNARPWGIAGTPVDREHNFGGSIGGPGKLPFLWSSKNKTYFFFNFEGFRQSGGVSRNLLTIPSMQERQGDFRDWVDSTGQMIPIYDPNTLRPNPAFNPQAQVGPANLPYLRDQFMGCDGKTPNVICQDRIQNSLAYAWFKYLPTPTYSGALNNFIALDEPGSFYNHTNHFSVRVDEYLGEKDRLFVSVYHRQAGPMTASELPKQISDQSNVYKDPWMNRLNWDHTFSPVLLNHFVAGYQDDMYHGGSLAAGYANLFPKIPGTSRDAYPPTLTFSDGFQSYKGDNRDGPSKNKNPAPAYVFTDLLTWVKGKHTFKMGAEYRKSANSMGWTSNEAGTFSFARGETGLLGINSGSPIASFLLEQVDYASVQWQPYSMFSMRNEDYITHFGDTFKVNHKLTVNWGLRWEIHPPYHEVHDVTSFFDPRGPNPGAGGRPGRVTFAGTRWGPASYGKSYPEELFTKGFSPRVGIAYSYNPKTVVRTGYGIFYDAGIVPGWSGGYDTTGFNLTRSFGSTNAGLAPAAILSQGLPTNYPKPPILDPTISNGQNSPTYRPFDANRLPYSQQWNLTMEREVTPNLTISAGYVGTKGTRLYSHNLPINVLDPKLLSMGNKLNDQFQPGQTELDGVNIPYTGWVEQMVGCAPSVAQALLPYPQYCNSIYGNNENAGNSTFHSFQMKVEKRWSNGLWFLGSYTLAKNITDSETNQSGTNWGGISPFERHRNKSLSPDDVPQTLVLSGMYDLPLGKGKRWLASGNRFVDLLVGGWRISSIFRANSGAPFVFRNYNACNVPGQFAVSCIPSVLPGANPWAQDKSHFDPTKPLFNVAAFTPVTMFNNYYGDGPRVSNLRGFGYTNQDFSLTKTFPIRERVNFQLRADAFNIWNWHHFANTIDTDISSGTFGMVNGTATTPRYIQVVGKINF